MGTVATLCVASTAEAVAELPHGSCLEIDPGSTLVDGDRPLARWRGRADAPTGPEAAYSVARFADGIVRVAFDGRDPQRTLGSRLSKVLDADVVVFVHQSAADAAYWALHSGGRLIREIEYGDGTLRTVRGEPLDFEGSEPGTNVSEDPEEPFVVFSDADIDIYNATVGLPVRVHEDEAGHWVNVTLSPSHADPNAASGRPTGKRRASSSAPARRVPTDVPAGHLLAIATVAGSAYALVRWLGS